MPAAAAGTLGVRPQMGTPNTDRVFAGAKASDQLDRQIVSASLLFTECCLARLGRRNCGEVFGLLEALDQRLVFGAAEPDGPALLAHRYASLRCATVSRTIVSAVRAARENFRPS